MILKNIININPIKEIVFSFMLVLKHKFKQTISIDIKTNPSSFIQKVILEIPNNIKSKNFYTLNHHEGFSIYTLYDLILASTINDIDYSIFTNLLKKR